jgi:serine phosphatase RsbU (regulator of sigma subunit)
MVKNSDVLAAKILIVDDNDANVKLLEGMLRIAGYTAVESTTNPNSVCELYRKNRYSLILLDLQMPGLDGFQVMEGLKEIEGEDYLPVLVVTAQPNHKLRALEAGAKDFVSKPLDLAEVRARVYNIIEVRLLHASARRRNQQLEEAVRELEASREIIRLKDLEDKKKMEAELRLAQQTQESLLPPFLPEFENFEIQAFNKPTRYVGGDFYDFQSLPSGEWMGVLADVSGKGISAALLSSMVLGALSMGFRLETPAPEIMNRINQLLYERSLSFQYITMFLFVLGPDGSGQFISAGHNPVYVYRAGTGKVEQLMAEHYFAGMFDFATYEARPFCLETDDILVIYSDGLTEAENQMDEMFGEKELLRIIREEGPGGGRALKDKLLVSVEAFTQGVPQSDDITFVVVERKLAQCCGG